MQRRRKFAWKYLMDEKSGLGKESIFDFKYIPTLRRTTREGQRKTYTFKRPGIELLSYFGLASAFMMVSCFGVATYLLAVKYLPPLQTLRESDILWPQRSLI
jgi:hypothetical protein